MTYGIKKPDHIDRYIGSETVAKAIEAFTKYPGLSKTAKLLGIELVNRFNARTLACFPSEKYLATALGVCDRQVRRAKTELRQKGLIDWRSGHRGRACEYVISWRKLKIALAEFRTKWAENNEADEHGLISLYNEIQTIDGGQSCPTIEQTADASVVYGRQQCPERGTCASALLSHENTHEFTQVTRGSADGDDAEASPSAAPRNQLKPIGDVVGAPLQEPSKSNGRNSVEEDQSNRSPPRVAAAALERARVDLSANLAPSIVDKLTDAQRQDAELICARHGFREAFEFICRERFKCRRSA